MHKILHSLKLLIRDLPWMHRLHLKMYKFLVKTLPKKITLKIDNQKIKVLTSDYGLSRRLILFGEHVPAVTNFMKDKIKDGMVVVDVGANIGYNTLLASKRVNNGKVYAFEPDPRCYELLTDNIKINNYHNTICDPRALAETYGNFSIYLDEHHLSSTTISKQNLQNNLGNNNTFGGKIEVEKITLDDYFNEISESRSVDFLKMNIQGAEGLVIAGSKNTIKKSNNMIILTEFWISGLKSCGTDPKKLLLEIKSLGFELYPVKGLGEGFYEGIDNDENYTINNLIDFVENPVNQKHDGMHLAFKKLNN